MSGCPAPASGGLCRLDRIAHVLAVGEAGLTQQCAVLAIDVAGIAAIGPGLPAADIEFRRSIQRVGRFVPARVGRDGFQGFGGAIGPGVGQQAFPAAFASEPAFTYPSEPGGGIEQVGGVDPDHARGQFRGDVEGEVDVLAPDCGGEAKARVVGQFHCFCGCAESGGDEDRAKDFLLHQRIGGVQTGDEGGGVVAARGGQGGLGLIDLTAGIVGDHFCDRVQLDRVYHRTHIDGFVERVADAQFVHAGAQLGVKGVCHRFLHQQA